MEYISSAFATFINMCAVEYMTAHKGIYLQNDDALKLFFENQQFKPRDSETINPEINNWRQIPYLHNVLSHILSDRMITNEICNSRVRVIHTRKDGLKLGVIDYLTIGLPLDQFDGDDPDGYDIDDREDLPRLVLIDDKVLCDRNYQPTIQTSKSNDEIYEFNFYKRNYEDTKPSYHHWEE